MTGRLRSESLAAWVARLDERYDNLRSRPHFVYRAFDDLGLLLYIGCSVDVERRMGGHRSASPWAQYATNVVSESYPCMADARAAESAAIESEASFFNATRGDIKQTQANRNAARRALASAGIYDPECTEEILDDPVLWAAYEDESGAYRELRDEVRAELKATTHPHLADEDRVNRYLAARIRASRAVA